MVAASCYIINLRVSLRCIDLQALLRTISLYSSIFVESINVEGEWNIKIPPRCFYKAGKESVWMSAASHKAHLKGTTCTFFITIWNFAWLVLSVSVWLCRSRLLSCSRLCHLQIYDLETVLHRMTQKSLQTSKNKKCLKWEVFQKPLSLRTHAHTWSVRVTWPYDLGYCHVICNTVHR